MQPQLLDFLATWSGRGAVQAALEERGFFIPRGWQQRVIDFCDSRDAARLNRYWDEIAREFVARAGKDDPNSRKTVAESRYRSSYLDELAARKDFESPQFRVPPLEKAVFEYVSRMSLDRTFLESELAAIEASKQEEIARHRITTDGWTGLKRDIVPFLRDFAVPKGFVARRNRFRKKLPQDFILDIKVDQGWIRECGNGLPLELFVYNADNPDFALAAPLLDLIVPGFCRYLFCQSPGSHVLGILAFVELADILSGSFSGP